MSPPEYIFDFLADNYFKFSQDIIVSSANNFIVMNWLKDFNSKLKFTCVENDEELLVSIELKNY